MRLSFRAAAAVVAAVAAAAATPVPPTFALRTYNASAPLDETATLSWTLTATDVRFGLVVTDAAAVNGSAVWVGLGVGEPTSGSMLGADIVTAEMTGDGACTLTNRHVPSVAIPLGSAVGGDAIFPVPDEACAAPAWTLAACAVDAAAGTVTLEVDRPLAAANAAQDRPIVAGRNVLMYAYGDGFGYHGGRRHGTEIDLTSTGQVAVSAGSLAESGLLPADVSATQRLSVPAYPVSPNRTDYGCSSFEIELGPGAAGRQIVAAEPVIDLTTAAGKLVHHFIVLSCERDELWTAFVGGGDCFATQPRCRDVVYGWAAGGGYLIMPKEAGFPVNQEERTYILQVHYDNPEGLTGVVDNSSAVLLHFTDTPRRFEAGTINIGDPFVALGGQVVESGRNYTIKCPSECTSQLAEPLTVFNSFLHAHRTALYLFTNQFRNNTLLRTLEGSHYWSNDHQRSTLFAEADFLPGDELEITGMYDTRKLDAARAANASDAEPPTVWGLGTPDEMLMSFLFVYPRPLRAGGTPNDTISYCGLVSTGPDGPWGTMCTNGLAFEEGTSVLAIDPLSENGRAGWGTPFGGVPQCAVASGADKDADGDDDESECFPASATVTVAGGGAVRMDALRLGDAVLTADGTYSRVYLWSHADAAAEATFVAITTCGPVGATNATCATAAAATTHTLTVSSGHLLPVHGSADAVAAGTIPVGAALVSPTGAPRPVLAVASVVGRGLFHPHTLAGNLVIDGAVVVTDRTTAVPAGVAGGGLAAARLADRVGLGGVLSAALGGGCPRVLRPALRALRAVSA